MASYTNTSIYLLDDDLSVIKRAAKKAGVKQSAFIREAALKSAEKVLGPKKQKRAA